MHTLAITDVIGRRSLVAESFAYVMRDLFSHHPLSVGCDVHGVAAKDMESMRDARIIKILMSKGTDFQYAKSMCDRWRSAYDDASHLSDMLFLAIDAYASGFISEAVSDLKKCGKFEYKKYGSVVYSNLCLVHVNNGTVDDRWRLQRFNFTKRQYERCD